ncbi:Hypothetical predicted protein [Marmota monax]|uniref:Uncharacterized protein n=1 Tax=Marmota monax TaxID=9995 RepID=A0A5E4AZQ7_MARMO|nr:Hypothetical predicted protein [Marmota monax]
MGLLKRTIPPPLEGGSDGAWQPKNSINIHPESTFHVIRTGNAVPCRGKELYYNQWLSLPYFMGTSLVKRLQPRQLTQISHQLLLQDLTAPGHLFHRVCLCLIDQLPLPPLLPEYSLSGKPNGTENLPCYTPEDKCL